MSTETKYAFQVNSLTMTGRQAAEQFATTFEGGREIVWHVDGNFHFVDGRKTYAVVAKPFGWRIKVISESSE
jgi:hypothetical protein